MRSNLFLALIVSSVAITGCNDDDDDSLRSIIVAGDPEGSYFYSDLPEPDTMLFTNIHVTTRDFDLNNDGEMDITFTAERDTVFDGTIPVRTMRKLSIKATDEEDNLPVFISTNSAMVRMYGKGFVINRNNATWTTLREEMPIIMAGQDQNLTSGQTENTGNWNTLREQCIGILIPSEPEVMVWFEMGVLNGDSWIYNDHAAFTLE